MSIGAVIWLIILLPFVLLFRALNDLGKMSEEGKRARAEKKNDGMLLGEVVGTWGAKHKQYVGRDTRLEHLTIIGATGAGKSTQATCYALQDMAASTRPGLLVLDVKDTLVFSIARHVPEQRIEDVLLFDAADRDYAPAFNPLAGVLPHERTLAAAEMLAALKRLFESSWGDRIEHVLRNVLLLLLDTPGATLLDITRVLVEPDFRQWALSHCGNFAVRGFFEHQYPALLGRNGALTNLQPVLNKLGILAYPEIRAILGQLTRGLDLRAAMDAGSIVLCHLPQGVLGEDGSSFLAALIAGKTQLAAQSRVTLRQPQRRPFYIFADEFQLYETGAFIKILTEGRAMGLGVVAINQFPEQLPIPLRLALEKNARYQVRTNKADRRYTAELVNLRLLEDDPNRVVPLIPLPPPTGGNAGQLEVIRAQSRHKLYQRRTVVEAALARRMAGSPNAAPRRTTTVTHVAAAPSDTTYRGNTNGHNFFEP